MGWTERSVSREAPAGRGTPAAGRVRRRPWFGNLIDTRSPVTARPCCSRARRGWSRLPRGADARTTRPRLRFGGGSPRCATGTGAPGSASCSQATPRPGSVNPLARPRRIAGRARARRCAGAGLPPKRSVHHRSRTSQPRSDRHQRPRSPADTGRVPRDIPGQGRGNRDGSARRQGSGNERSAGASRLRWTATNCTAHVQRGAVTPHGPARGIAAVSRCHHGIGPPSGGRGSGIAASGGRQSAGNRASVRPTA